jgi:catechol 2,3-dioxygenase-like lactoylglutathione lyase family enzyme
MPAHPDRRFSKRGADVNLLGIFFQEGFAMIKSLAHVCVGAKDLEASERFYCQGLGLKKIFDFIRDGKRFGCYLEVSKNNYIEIFLRTDEMVDCDKGPIKHLCIEVDDIDWVGRQLKEQGYSVTDKKMGWDNSWQCWATDPSGVKIEFQQYTAKSSQRTGANCVM